MKRMIIGAALRALRPGTRLRFVLVNNAVGAAGLACWFWKPWLGALIFGLDFTALGLLAISVLTIPTVATRYFKTTPLPSEVRSELLLCVIAVPGGLAMFVLAYAEWVDSSPF